MARERGILIWSQRVVAKPSLVLLKANVDRTSDLIRKVYSVHHECCCATVVGRFELFLCDDHYGAQG